MNGEKTVKELKETIVTMLTIGGCESPEFDATCLLEDIGKLGRGKLASALCTTLDSAVCQQVLNAASRRASGEPLQYLLGTWDFLGLTLQVGKGVLIPRPETEQLCEFIAQQIDRKSFSFQPEIWDLCAGTGCIGLGIASLSSKPVHVTAVEMSQDAFDYLRKNLNTYKQYDITPIKANILTDFERFTSCADFIVCNPPYIPNTEIARLQREVRHEPVMALDGGDGYRFYRVLANRWTSKLVPGGLLAVEVGIDQAVSVAELFSAAGLENIRILKDFSGIDRIVSGEKPKAS